MIFPFIPNKDTMIQVKKTRRKTLCIKITPNGQVHIMAPLFSTKKEILHVINLKKKWITKKLTQCDQRNLYQPHTHIWDSQHYILGNLYRINYQMPPLHQNGSHWVMEESNMLYKSNTPPSSPHKILIQFYKNLAQRLIQDMDACYEIFVKQYPQYRTKKPTLQIKWMKQSWGRMSVQSHMILNTQLIKLHPHQIHYVILHELSHLIHFNHSRDFYQTLESLYPGAKNIQKEIKKFPLDKNSIS